MTIDDEIRNEKLKCNINREATKISALSSGKIYMGSYSWMLPSDQCQKIEQYKFTYTL